MKIRRPFFWLEYKVLERGRYCFLDMWIVAFNKVKRICNGIEKIENKDKKEEKNQQAAEGKPVVRTVIAALICCLVDFGIAQFGLLTLIQKAYSALAYLAVPVILIPYIIHMIVTRFDSKNWFNVLLKISTLVGTMYYWYMVPPLVSQNISWVYPLLMLC